MWIGLLPAECLFFGLVLCFLPFNLSHISIPSIVPKKKKKWIISHSLLLSLVCSCGCMGFKSSTAFSSAWKKGAELRQCLHSLFMHMDELRGNVSTKKKLSPKEGSLLGILNLYIILRKKKKKISFYYPVFLSGNIDEPTFSSSVLCSILQFSLYGSCWSKDGREWKDSEEALKKDKGSWPDSAESCVIWQFTQLSWPHFCWSQWDITESWWSCCEN